MHIVLKGPISCGWTALNWPLSPKERDEWIINDAKLWLDTGSMFGVDGEDFERINVACPRKVLEEGLEAWRRAYEAKGF